MAVTKISKAIKSTTTATTAVPATKGLSDIQQRLMSKDYTKYKMLDLEGYHKNVFGSGANSGPLTIINHEKCGRRLHVSNEIWRELGCPRFVKVHLCDGDLLIKSSNCSTDVAVKFSKDMDYNEAVKTYKGKIVLYVSKTVIQLSSEWNLKDNGKRCSYTGGEYVVREILGVPTAIICWTGTSDSQDLDSEDEDADTETEASEEYDTEEEVEETDEAEYEEDSDLEDNDDDDESESEDSEEDLDDEE